MTVTVLAMKLLELDQEELEAVIEILTNSLEEV